MSDAITCTACRLSVNGGDERREHYRSDLHRVNLKRKVTGMGPLTQTELVGRLQVLQEQRKEAGREKQICELCSKKFSSRKALDNHIKSKRHRDALMRMDMSLVDSDSFIGERDEHSLDGEAHENRQFMELDEQDVDNELERRMAEWKGDQEGLFNGIFDTTWHGSSKEAFEHARKAHGLFLPYEEHVKDWDGLMRYLGQKVGIGYACVCCDRGFGSADAARRHMKDVGHCRMGEDWVEEYEEYYRLTDDDGWMEVEEGEDVEDGAEIVGRLDESDGDEVGLVVGDKVIGHRSFARYYRQGVGRSDDQRVAVLANKSAVQESRMIGWRKFDKESVKIQRDVMRRKQKFELVVGGQNYYTRKARFKQKMAVFNSGYRA